MIREWFYKLITYDGLELPEVKRMSTSEIINIYGYPQEKPDYLVYIDLPYPMYITWGSRNKVTRIACHKLVASDLLAIFKEILETYGIENIKHLGIDQYGGCFNFRKMRDGNDWSRHSWGIAIDLDPERNKLKTPWKKANFRKPEYHALFRIFYKYGFYNLGLKRGRDAMHFEKGMKL